MISGMLTQPEEYIILTKQPCHKEEGGGFDPSLGYEVFQP
jgi:hypothetical protein